MQLVSTSSWVRAATCRRSSPCLGWWRALFVSLTARTVIYLAIPHRVGQALVSRVRVLYLPSNCRPVVAFLR